MTTTTMTMTTTRGVRPTTMTTSTYRRRTRTVHRASSSSSSSDGETTATGGGFDLARLARVLKKKTAMDIERVFNGTSKTREKLSAVNDVLALWRMDDFEEALEELEETLLGVDFGPEVALAATDGVRARRQRQVLQR